MNRIQISKAGVNFVAGLTMLFIMIGTSPLLQAQTICFPGIGGLAGPPTIDGIVEAYRLNYTNVSIHEDLGWNGALRVNLSANLGASRATVFQAGTTSSPAFLYLSFKVDAPPPGQDNTIVLQFSTDNNSADDWRIFIQPFSTATSGANFSGDTQSPQSVTYWRNSANWNNASNAVSNPQTAGAGFWLYDNMKFSKELAVDGSSWAIELKIPWLTTVPPNYGTDSSQGIYFPTSGTFNIYFDVLSTETLTAMVTEDPWPPSGTIPPGAPYFLTQMTPDSSNYSKWATASLDSGQCSGGVSLAYDDIGVVDPNSNPNDPNSPIVAQIRRYDPGPPGFPEATEADCQNRSEDYQWPATQGPTNTFVARPNNTGANPAKVSATFWIADWGIPGPQDPNNPNPSADWAPLGVQFQNTNLMPPAPPNPACPNYGINKNSCLGVSGNPTNESPIGPGKGNLTATWNLTYRWSCLYARYADNDHCIQVNLDSSDPSVIFSNKSVQRNILVVPGSGFSHSAIFSDRSFGKPPLGRASHELLVFAEESIQKYTRDGDYYHATCPFTRGVTNVPTYGTTNVSSRDRATATTTTKGQASCNKYSEFSQLPADLFPKGLAESSTWMARGYLKMGDYLIINNNKYEYAKLVGGFGAVVGHEKAIAQWTHNLTGPACTGGGAACLEKLPNGINMYRAQLPPNSTLQVRASVVPGGCGADWPKLIGVFLFAGVFAVGALAYWPNRKRA
jgi:hypothetical protein